jgi:hypothetical protein
MNTTERLLQAGAQAQVTNKMGAWDSAGPITIPGFFKKGWAW